MKMLWTFKGKCFGYREGNDLWTNDGKHIGRFIKNEIYGRDGKYLGEIIDGDRLIFCESKQHLTNVGFAPYVNRVGKIKHVDQVGRVMYVGHKDFPSPDKFK